MKFKSDFVTNSSSSSFIFDKTIDKKILQKKIKELADKVSDEYTSDTLTFIYKHLDTFEDLSIEELSEIVNWYFYEEDSEEKNLEKVFLITIINLAYDKYYNSLDLGMRPLIHELVQDIKDDLYEIFDCGYFDENKTLLEDNFEKLFEFYDKFKDKPYEYIENLFGCKYLYFSDYSIDSNAADKLRGLEECKYSCNHMG